LVPRLTGSGFKILVDLLASSSTIPRIGEVPYRFRNRQLGGERRGGISPPDCRQAHREMGSHTFCIIHGALGVGVHLAVLAPLYLNHHHPQAQVIASLVAMTFNFS
jgi:dolichol-phosphate mannosyltransferase